MFASLIVFVGTAIAMVVGIVTGFAIVGRLAAPDAGSFRERLRALSADRRTLQQARYAAAVAGACAAVTANIVLLRLLS